MRFIEWLRIDELSSMSQIDSSGVELKKSEEGYEYKFDDFVVRLNHWHGKKVGDKMVDGIWEVSFKRGKSYALTGTSGSGGTAVYGKILGAVKKLTEIEEVNGLKFIGAEARQDIMYDKFLKTLGGFTHVGSDIYMRDEVVKANASGEDLEYYKGVGEKRENGIYNMKVAKVASRNKGLIGKITGYMNSPIQNAPAIIWKMNSSGLFTYLSLLVWDGHGVSEKDIDSSGLEYVIKSPSSIDQSLISSLMGEIQKDDSDLSKYLKTLGLKVDGSTYDFGFKKETA
jgi:hypothetical protein